MTHATSADTGRKRWVPVLVVVLLAAAVAAVLLIVRDTGDGTPSGSTSPSTIRATAARVAAFSGPAATTTTTFKAAVNWELRWTAPRGSGFSVELLKADGTSRGVVVQAGSRTSGSTFVGEAGTFKLKIKSTKAWSVQVHSRPVG